MSEYTVNTPLSPNALPIPPVRRGVSMDPAFDVFEGNQGFDQDLSLNANQSDAPVYAFETGAGNGQDGSENPAEDLTFDYMPASNNTGMGEETNEALSPQQAQQEMRKLQQQLREQQEANMTAPSSSLGPSNDENKESPSSMEDASSPSDESLNPNGLAFPSMNRGSSNIQAALEELQTAEYAATHAQHQQHHMPTPSPRGELSHSQQSWHEYSHSEHEGGYHSDAYTSATDTEEHEMLDPPERRQEYDGTYQVHVTSAQPHSTIPGHHNHMYGSQPHSSSGSHHSLHHTLPHTHGHQNIHTSPPHQLHHHGHHGHHGHHHGHHHHSHSHSHSVPPTVPSVAEQEREDIDAPPQEMPAEDKQLLDSSFLSGLRNSPLPPTLSYSRSNSASSASSAGVRSGGSSPQPNHRQVFQPGQVALLQQAGIILSPQPQTSVPQRRHSGHATLQVSHLLNPNAATALSHSRPLSPSNTTHSMPPIFRPGLDRSPSVDGLSRQQRPVSASPQLPSGPEGKGLYLHPSPIQEQMQQAYYHSHHANSHSHHNHSHAQSASASPPAVATNPASGGHKLVPPASAPSLGRSFSHDSLSTAHIQVKQEVYYSDGGSGYSSAQPSPRGSMTFPHGVPGVSSPAPNSASQYTSPPPLAGTGAPHFGPASGYASTTSSGAATPLRGPAPVRGSNSLNDLHHLLLLHQQSSTSSANRSLLPTCPTGAASSPAAAGHPASSERIGAYTREERAKRVARYQDKRTRRNWQKRVLYQVRKDFAVSRKRVGGRFIKKENSSCDCPDLCLPTCPHYKPKDIKVEEYGSSSRKK